MQAELNRFREALASGGLVASLRVLSERTAFRYTGVYRYSPIDGGDAEQVLLRNVALVDRQDSSVTSGPSVPMADAYCDYLGSHGDSDGLEFGDISCHPLLPRKANNPALSYCGVVIRDSSGRAVGSLCYYDTLPCQPRPDDLALLRAAASLIAPLIA